LPQTKLGTYLENRVNSFLKKKDAGAGEVTIRVLASSEKIVEVKPGKDVVALWSSSGKTLLRRKKWVGGEIRVDE